MPFRKILLMYISQISGHRSAAIAIENSLKTLEPDAEVIGINAFNYTNPIAEKFVNRIYMNVIQRIPRVWDYLYDNPRVARRIGSWKEFVHKINLPKLKKLIDDIRPDCIACTQAYPCGMVADYKKEYRSNIPLVAVLTDYVPHSYWVYDTVDCYVVPSEEVAQRLYDKGVGREKIRVFGIPFDHKFNLEIDRREECGRLGLDPGIPTVLVMGGGHGLGPIKDIIRRLNEVSHEIQLIVICGSNKKLYESLRKRVSRYRRKTLLFAFTDQVSELMSVSDILITKPGGITTAEALAKGIPMIIVKPIPGQEANNADYLTSEGAAIRLNVTGDLTRLIDGLLEDKPRLEGLGRSARLISRPQASRDIARLLLEI